MDVNKNSKKSKTVIPSPTFEKNDRMGKSTKVRVKLKQRNASDYCIYKEQLSKKFQQMSKSQTFLKAKNKFLKHLGRHSPICYAPKFNFKQQWEMSKIQQKQPEYKNTALYLVFSLVRLLLMCITMWTISTNLFFPMANFNWNFILMLVLSFIETIKLFVDFRRYSKDENLLKITYILISTSYSLFFLIRGVDHIDTIWSRIIGIAIVLQTYKKFSNIYQTIKYYNISSQYRDILNLFQLSILLITITHIFAIVLCAITEINVYQNWMITIGINTKPWYQKYIYSLYFSSTTLLTVGYGDIAPTNIHQILAILLTQFFGIATFGYTVNQIGMALSSIQLKTQRLQKDLSHVENIGKSARLEQDLICKMRSQVINNKRLDEDLCLQQENQLLDSFSQDMRQKIKFESNIKVLKRSAFMILNWTGKMQNKIANKLIKEVYKTDQLLTQQAGKQKLYILQKGKLDIIRNNKNQKMCIEKVLKTICAQENNQLVAENVYGYSFLISQRKINLNAVAKQTSICYTLNKNDFLEILAQCNQDLEHYHEVKCLINESSIPQQIEAPSIVNIRQHYRPLALILTRREKESLKSVNLRKPHKNRNKDRRKLIMSNTNTIKTLKTHCQSMINRNWEKFQKSFKLESIDETDNQISLSLVSVNSSIDIYQFQECKSYERYFKKGNIQNVINKLNTVNYNMKNSLQIQIVKEETLHSTKRVADSY